MRVLPYAGALRCGGLAGPRTSSTRANIFAGHTCTCRQAVRHQTEAWRCVAWRSHTPCAYRVAVGAYRRVLHAARFALRISALCGSRRCCA